MGLLAFGNRNILRLALCALPSVCIVDGLLVEPEWVVTRKLSLGGRRATHRLVHFTDLHYRGDRRLLKGIVDAVNRLDPDFACFTGDIIENKRYLREALGLLRRIRVPLYGVPGNHDYWSGAPFDEIAEAFDATGGAWLVDREAKSPDGRVVIVGASSHDAGFIRSARGGKRLLLTHYPAFSDMLKGRSFSLILAGHSHGGQVRIPFWGAPFLPWGTGEYDRGLYFTPAGPLYVNPGIGTFYVRLRLFCRPELTEISF